MRSSDQLAQFVEKALAKGKSRDEIEGAMTGAGWSASEINEAMNTWAESDFDPPYSFYVLSGSELPTKTHSLQQWHLNYFITLH